MTTSTTELPVSRRAGRRAREHARLPPLQFQNVDFSVRVTCRRSTVWRNRCSTRQAGASTSTARACRRTMQRKSIGNAGGLTAGVVLEGRKFTPLDHQRATQVRVIKGIGLDRQGPLPLLTVRKTRPLLARICAAPAHHQSASIIRNSRPHFSPSRRVQPDVLHARQPHRMFGRTAIFAVQRILLVPATAPCASHRRLGIVDPIVARLRQRQPIQTTRAQPSTLVRHCGREEHCHPSCRCQYVRN